MVTWLMGELFKVITSIIGGLLIWFTNSFMDNYMSLSFSHFFDSLGLVAEKNYYQGYITSTSLSSDNIVSAIQLLAIFICVLVFMWQLIRCITGLLAGDVDDPIIMSIRFVLCILGIILWPAIANQLQSILNIPLKTFKTSMHSTRNDFHFISKLSNAIDANLSNTSLTKELKTLGFANTTVLLNAVVFIIALIAIGWNYIKFLIECVERYVVYVVLTLLAPLAISTGPSRSTTDILKKYSRMYISSILMIFMNVLGIYLVETLMLNAAFTSGSYLTWVILMYSVLLIMQKIDKYFAQTGMYTAQTGGIGLDLLAVARATKGVRGKISKGVSSAAKNYRTNAPLRATKKAYNDELSRLTAEGRKNGLGKQEALAKAKEQMVEKQNQALKDKKIKDSLDNFNNDLNKAIRNKNNQGAHMANLFNNGKKQLESLGVESTDPRYKDFKNNFDKALTTPVNNPDSYDKPISPLESLEKNGEIRKFATALGPDYEISEEFVKEGRSISTLAYDEAMEELDHHYDTASNKFCSDNGIHRSSFEEGTKGEEKYREVCDDLLEKENFAANYYLEKLDSQYYPKGYTKGW